MRIHVTASPGATRASLREIDATHFKISVQEPARENLANLAILQAVAAHFRVPLSRVRFTHGLKSKQKVIEVMI
ncbi:MAG TPA: DUF167 family protein [Candidatus Paceibacterota bacterium]